MAAMERLKSLGRVFEIREDDDQESEHKIIISKKTFKETQLSLPKRNHSMSMKPPVPIKVSVLKEPPTTAKDSSLPLFPALPPPLVPPSATFRISRQPSRLPPPPPKLEEPIRTPEEILETRGPKENEKEEQEKGDDLLNDLLSLKNPTEENVATYIDKRYKSDKIYTYIGNILIAVNPYKHLPIYSKEILSEYSNERLGSLPPHVFGIAEDAYSRMMLLRRNQSIIIGGESGSGKTESAKLVISYLATKSGGFTPLNQSLVQSSPILESFGNARTIRNNNSSRFAKYLQIDFGKDGEITQGYLRHYMLEKTRLVDIKSGEGTFHIFYQLCLGADDQLRERLRLYDMENFHFFQGGGAINEQDSDEYIEGFFVTDAALSTVATPNQKLLIYSLISAILHLGNISLGDLLHKSPDHYSPETRDALRYSSILLGVSESVLSKYLTSNPAVFSGQQHGDGSSVEQVLQLSEMLANRNSLIKELYGKLFSWLVYKINYNLNSSGHAEGSQVRGSGSSTQKKEKFKSIVLLDVFGFEDFGQGANCFEQFCINYANEAMQLFCNHRIFYEEHRKYQEEGIEVQLPANMKILGKRSECLDLITKVLIPMFDSYPAVGGSAPDLVSQMHSKKGSQCPRLKKGSGPSSFIVIHYAGDVSYQCENFVEKNQEKSNVFNSLLAQSKSDFIRTLIRLDPAPAARPDSPKETTIQTFRLSLEQLLNQLKHTHPHYIRCLKPNNMKVPDNVDQGLILKQLRDTGTLETMEIRLRGFPQHMTFFRFNDRYSPLDRDFVLLPEEGKDKPAENQRKATTRLAQGAIPPQFGKMYQIGKTEIFLKDRLYGYLEDRLLISQYKAIKRLQGWYKTLYYRRRFLKIRHAVPFIQAFWRFYAYRHPNRYIPPPMNKRQSFSMSFSVAPVAAAARSVSPLQQPPAIETPSSSSTLVPPPAIPTPGSPSRPAAIPTPGKASLAPQIRPGRSPSPKRQPPKLNQPLPSPTPSPAPSSTDDSPENLTLQDAVLKHIDRVILNLEKSELQMMFALFSDREEFQNTGLFQDLIPKDGKLEIQIPDNSKKVLDTIGGVKVTPMIGRVKSNLGKGGLLPQTLQKGAVEPMMDPLKSDWKELKLEEYGKKNWTRHGVHSSGRAESLERMCCFTTDEIRDSVHAWTEEQRERMIKIEQLEIEKESNKLKKGGRSEQVIDKEIQQLLDFQGGIGARKRVTKEKGDSKKKETKKDRRGRRGKRDSDEYDSMKVNTLDDEETRVIDRIHDNFIKGSVICFNTLLEYQTQDYSRRIERQQSGIEKAKEAQERGEDVQLTEREKLVDDWKSIHIILTEAKKNPPVADDFNFSDELLCHLMRQTHKCPKIEIAERGWQMFAFIAPFHYPTPRLDGYVASYLNRCIEEGKKAEMVKESKVKQSRQAEEEMEIAILSGEWAKYVLHRLERHKHQGPRKSTVGLREFQAVKEKTDFDVIVYLETGESEIFQIDSSGSLGEIFSAVVGSVGLKDPRGWTIFEVRVDEERGLREEDLLGDHIADLDLAVVEHEEKTWTDAMEDPTCQGYRLMFKKKFFVDPKVPSPCPIQNRLLYCQIREDFLHDRLISNTRDMLRLAALLMQAELGKQDYDALIAERDRRQENREKMIHDQESEHYLPVIDPFKWLPRIVISSSNRTVQEWEDWLIKLHKSLMELPQHLAAHLFLNLSRLIPTFGVTVVLAEHRSDWDLPAKLGIGVGISGIYFLDPVTRQIHYHFPMWSLRRYYDDRQSFFVFFDYVGKLYNIRLFTDEALALTQLVQDYELFLESLSCWGRTRCERRGAPNTRELSFIKFDLIEILSRTTETYWECQNSNRQKGFVRPEELEVILLPNQMIDPQSSPKMEEVEDDLISLTHNLAMLKKDGEEQQQFGSFSSNTTGKKKKTMIHMTKKFATQKVPPVDTAKFSMKVYATRKFRTEKVAGSQKGSKKGSKKGSLKGYDMTERLKFSKKPLDDSLVTMKSPAFNHLSLEIFVQIQKIMGDLKMGKKEREEKSRNDLMREVIQHGLDEKELRDEIYCQLIKQTTDNPSKPSNVAGWGFLSLLCGSFLPSEEFAKYLIGYIQETKMLEIGPMENEAKFAGDCFERLGRTLQKGERTLSPSDSEIVCVEGRVPMLFKVHLLDGVIKTLLIDSACVVSEALELLYTNLAIPKNKERLCYGLYQVCDDLQQEYYLRDADNLCDRIRFAESFEPPKGYKGQPVFYFLFKRRIEFYDPNTRQPESLDPRTRHFVFIQAAHEILSGKQPIATPHSLQLGALKLIATTATLGGEEDLKNYIPEQVIKKERKKTFAQWKSELEASREKLSHVTPSEAKHSYIRFCQQWKPFSSSFFRAKQISQPHNILVGVQWHGMFVLVPNERNPLFSYGFQNILSFAPAPNSITVQVGHLTNPYELKYFSDQIEQMSISFQAYVNMLNERLNAKKQQIMIERAVERQKQEERE